MSRSWTGTWRASSRELTKEESFDEPGGKEEQ